LFVFKRKKKKNFKFKEKDYVPDEFEDFGLGALALFHSLLHGRDDDLSFILGSVLGTLFGRPYSAKI
jgi:hypothetical protein